MNASYAVLELDIRLAVQITKKNQKKEEQW